MGGLLLFNIAHETGKAWPQSQTPGGAASRFAKWARDFADLLRNKAIAAPHNSIVSLLHLGLHSSWECSAIDKNKPN